MHALSPISLISFYVLLTLIGVLMLALFVWQVQVLRGKAMMNPDRSVDSWREQRILFGIALADIVIACPLAFAGIANLATTATSLKFERPQITLIWFVTFPFAGLVGLAFLIWIVVHFEAVFAV
jgi:hypothetical protein